MDKPAIQNWYRFALVGIFVFSFLLRFWRVGFLNTLVFDEVYYPVFANRYLLGEPVYNAHPPLTQGILALGLWLGSHLPLGQDITNGLLGSIRSTFSYRWLNAFTGSFIPLVVGAIAYQLTHRRSYSAIAALFAALDGLFLVESRLALNNIYLVIFGLLGQLFLLLALAAPPTRRWYKLVFSGLFFGLSASIKWNGLGFLLGIYLVWFVACVFNASTQGRKKDKLPPTVTTDEEPYSSQNLPPLARAEEGSQNPLPRAGGGLQNLTQLNLFHIIFYLGIIPVATYCLSWVPHLLVNPKPGFWEMQQRILTFHQTVGSGPKVHPYCSPWYSWLIMWRPVAYLYQTARNLQEKIPSLPPLPKESVKVIYDVHAMGNPFLWWLSTAAIFLVLCLLIQRIWSKQLSRNNFSTSSWLAIYLIFNYGANLLPWLKVTRCTFIYHYMASSVFSSLAIAWLVDTWLRSPRYIFRQIALAIIIVIILAFFFWLPIFMGLPLSPTEYKIRMWFPKWS
jgi:dolichyl-phosphate-mannose-protein mannosyltransferase